jgi:hypothetical protein
MENLCNATCLQYQYPSSGWYGPKQSNEGGTVSNLSREGLPNCREWEGVFSPNNGEPPVFVRVVDLEKQICVPLSRV